MAEQRLRYYITGDAKGLNAALNRASSRVSAFGNKLKSVGASLQRFSAIGALAGGAAIKMGADFDKSMTKIKALVGVAGDEVDAMSSKVRQMAKQTGVSSSEAADALFFITSAGLRGSDAMDVLNASLKASASGLGETKAIADLATSAMNAYGKENLSASGATDILTAAVREGKLESSELASVMGQVLPTASAVGLEFKDVGAAMAAMSRTGTPAAQAATQLNAILSALLKTTPAQADAFAAMGLSAAGLRQQIKDEGLLSVLGSLKQGIDGNAEAAAAIFPNVRALRGILDLTGSGAEQAAQIFNSMNNTLGDTQKAFDTTAQSASFKLKASLNIAKESFAEMGAVLLQTLLPLIQDLAGIVTRAFNAFNNLDAGTQKIIAGVGVLALALPTLISLFGTLMSTLAALTGPVGLIAAGVAAIAYVIYKNWAEVAPVIVGLYNQFVDLYNSSLSLRTVIAGVGVAFKTVFIATKTTVFEFINVFKTMWNLVKEFSEKGINGDFKGILSKGFEDAKQIASDGADEIGDAFDDGFSQAFGSRLEKKTVEQLNTTLTNVKNKVSGTLTDFFSGLTGGTGLGGGAATPTTDTGGDTKNTQASIQHFTNLFNTLGNVGNKADETKEKIKGLSDNAMLAGQGMEQVFGTLGSNISQSFETGSEGLNAFLSTLVSGAIKYIGVALAKSTAGGIESGVESAKSMGPAAAFVLPALIAGAVATVSGAFKKVPKFAKGGIVSTPTLGMFGEYPGARSNPEVVAPLDKLSGMLANNGGSSVQVGGEFRLKGQDLVVALQRADRIRNRIK